MLERFRPGPALRQDRLALIAYEWRNSDTPWLTAQMFEILATTNVVLESELGRSTAWLAKRVLTSIEDNTEWSVRVEQMISDSGCGQRVMLRFVLADGTLHDYCAAVAIERLKRGGILITNNVERYFPPRKASFSERRGFGWEHECRAIEDWRCIWTSNSVADTAL